MFRSEKSTELGKTDLKHRLKEVAVTDFKCILKQSEILQLKTIVCLCSCCYMLSSLSTLDRTTAFTTED